MSLHQANNEEDGKEDTTKVYKAENDPKILRYRKYLRLAGLNFMVKNSDLNAMKSKKARYDFLSKIFTDAGYTKSLSIENCKKFKLKLEQEKEIAELDKGKKRIFF